MTSTLEAFLSRNSVAASRGLPLVHSTRSHNIKFLLDDDSIKPTRCDVFTDDDLNYFFVGRPAYKYESDTGQALHWELPCCFIFESDAVTSIKRVFPFDSGAFNGKLYPGYINSMKMADYQVERADAPGKLIGAFFGTPERYMTMRPKPREDFEAEYSIGPLESELSALSQLASEQTISKFDDRRFTIEVQSESAIQLAHTHPIAVVLPEKYLDQQNIRDHIEQVWKAEPIGYPMSPLSLVMYYGIIYSEVLKFYKRKKFIP